MKFDYVIGNPPYNDEQGNGNQKNFAKPVYHLFIDEAYKIAKKVELIHPARFLFNAGATPKEWNKKMLNDNHLKVLLYEQDSRNVFGANVSISGGIVVTYHNMMRTFNKIKVFTPFSELNSVINKVSSVDSYVSFDKIIYLQNRFNLEELYKDYPEYKKKIGSNGKDSRLERNIFEKIDRFTENRSLDTDIRILGMEKRKRKTKYISKQYIDLSHENLFSYKVIVSTSNGGAGNLGKDPVSICGIPEVYGPGTGYTRTFLGIGSFESKQEALNCANYIKTKFCRCMLGVLKATQLMNKDVWHMIPLQDFSDSSDIDWSQSIKDVDQQLYRKYGLDEKEIAFIEKHVKEMA